MSDAVSVLEGERSFIVRYFQDFVIDRTSVDQVRMFIVQKRQRQVPLDTAASVPIINLSSIDHVLRTLLPPRQSSQQQRQR